jgi:hypothetical protein
MPPGVSFMRHEILDGAPDPGRDCAARPIGENPAHAPHLRSRDRPVPGSHPSVKSIRLVLESEWQGQRNAPAIQPSQ